MNASQNPKQKIWIRLLRNVEKTGNKLPDPVTLFFLASALIMLLSWIFAGAQEHVLQRDGISKLHTVRSLMSREGLRWVFENMVSNFVGFAPLGSVLTIMLGIGVAERTGFIRACLSSLVQKVPPTWTTMTIVFAGVMSSMAADAGYIALTPLGAVIFYNMGRHPLAGLAAAFAGVSGGFSANLIITGLDPLLSGISTEAARLIDPTYEVLPTANYYFMIASTALITFVGTVVTQKVVEPTLGPYVKPAATSDEIFAEESAKNKTHARAFRFALLSSLVVFVMIVLLGAIPSSPLRINENSLGLLNSLKPFLHAIEILIAFLFFVPGVVYGFFSNQIKNDKDVSNILSETMSSMGAYIVLAFAAAQFIALFNWSHMGSISAVKGANFLRYLDLEGLPLLLCFIATASIINLFVGSASAKWAFMAPIFIPMLMQMGLSPEATQAAYRIGDSISNIVSPLMPYTPIVIIFAQRYKKDAGFGTLASMMVPYTIAFALGWVILFGIWMGFSLPLGPNASFVFE